MRWQEGNSVPPASTDSAHSADRVAEPAGLEASPALIREEVGQGSAQELGIELRRVFHPAIGQQPFPELQVELLAAGEPRLLEVGGSLEPGIALQRGAELMQHAAAETETAVVKADGFAGH